MTAPDATLTGRLREVNLAHGHSGFVNSREEWVECLCDARLSVHFNEWRDADPDAEDEARAAHLADVAAQTVAAWLQEQRETVAEGICACIPEVFDADCPCDDHAAAALAALVAAIGGAE